MPIEERLKAFVVAIANGSYHRTALVRCRLDWGRDVAPRLKKGDRHDAELAAEYAAARAAGDELRQIMRIDAMDQRGVDGWDEVKSCHGVELERVRRYSDGLLTAAAKAGDPARFADRHEHSGPEGGAFVVQTAIPEPRPPPKE